MLNLLQPIWLLVATLTVIPVIIHLWNVRQGKILKVGSILFLKQSSKNYASSLKLTELALLVLRCLLIILLALLLAKPRWDRSFEKTNIKGWVLMEKENLTPAYDRFKLLIDSLVQAGYEFHYFNAGFNKANLQEALKNQKNTILNNPLSYRILLKQLEQLVPAELPVYLFTTNYLNRQKGSLRPVSLNLHWHIFTPPDSLAVFVSKAYTISTDSLRMIVGRTGPAGTVYRYEDIDKQISSPFFHIDSNDNKLYVSYQNEEPIVVDTTALGITIFTDQYFRDAGYLKAATEAVQQFSRRRIRLSVVNKMEAISSVQDWLFWLSELPVPGAIKARNIFKYQAGAVKNTSSWINTNTVFNSDEERIGLFKLITPQDVVDPPAQVWRDGFGNTVLSLEKREINTWRLFTHFDPAWNDLPWNSVFPELIFNLVYPPDKEDPCPAHDKRIISQQQLLPVNNVKDPGLVKQKVITTDITHIFWLLAFMIFSIERFISSGNRKEVVYG